MLYFSQLDRTQLEGREFGHLGGGARRRLGGLVRGAFVAAVIFAVVGPLKLHWGDDVRSLDLPAPELQANEVELRALFGESAGRSIYLTHGKTLPEARERLEAFHAFVAQSSPPSTAASVGLLLPPEADWRALPGRLSSGAGSPRIRLRRSSRRGVSSEARRPPRTTRRLPVGLAGR
jgi:hypothetical protein